MLQIKNIYDFYNKSPSKQNHHIFTICKELLEGELKEDIKDLCVYLWENPNIIITLIKNSYNKYLNKNLLQLITNRFYTNFYSDKIIEPQLFYIISYFLKEELNSLTFDKKYEFLKKSICYQIFKQLRRNSELIKYFRIIVKDIIKDVHEYSSQNIEINDIILNKKIYLNISQIEELINTKKNEEKKFKEKYSHKNNKKLTNKNKNINNINEKIINYDEISKKYFNNVTKSFLEEKISSSKKNIFMKEYFEYQLKSFDVFNNEKTAGHELFANNNLIKHISSCSIKEIDKIYKRNFSLNIHFLDKLLNILNEKINEIPYEIRQICKLIKYFTIEKFPEIKKFQVNGMIGIFLFENIIFPFFTNPQLNGLLMVSKNISEDLYYNIVAITKYLKCFYLGYFYFEYNDESDYTPFNNYFIEKISFLDKILEKICDVDIPVYIQKLVINNKNEEIDENIFDFKSLYSERYYIYHQSFLLSFGDLYFIMKNIYVNHPKLFENEKNSKLYLIWDKIFKNKFYKEYMSGKATKENPISKDISDKTTKIKKTPIEKDIHQIYEFMNNIGGKPSITKEYFIINNLVFNEDEKTNFEIKFLNENILNFDINNISNILPILNNSFCEILNNLPSFENLMSSNQIICKDIKNFTTFLLEVKNYFEYYYFNHKNFEQITKSIELKWALNFFIENESKLSEDLKANNYNLFFAQLENDLNSSIKKIKDSLSKISHIYDNNINIIKTEQQSSLILSKLKKMNLNYIVQYIIQKVPIYIQISIKTAKIKNKHSKSIWNDLVFEIKKGKTKEDKWYDINNVYISEKNNYVNFKTIEAFLENFSFENEYFNHNENHNIFDYLYHLKIPEKINAYMDSSLKEMLLEKLVYNIYSKQDIPNITLNLKKNILCGLYDIIYKNYVPYPNDNLLFKKLVALSWTNLSNFTNESFPLQKSLIPSIVECLKKLEKKKIPKEKLGYLIKINEILSFIHCSKQISYNNKKLNIINYLNPILIYSIIKAKLKYLPSDIRFIEVFNDEKEKGMKFVEEIKNHILFINDLTHKDLYGNITEDDYNKNCNFYLNEEKE